jgi:galactokinase
VEIGGNHTDHQRGHVLAAAVELEISAAVKPNGLNVVRFQDTSVDINALDVRDGEKETSAALIRGVAAWFSKHGHAVGGFDAEITSTVPVGAGLSSSAAFEVLIGNIFKSLFGADVSQIDIARAGQFAENVYFGKPCGLMDQTASSFGGINVIDFENLKTPIVTPVQVELSGYSMCIVDTGGSHADLTPDYAACPAEMKSVAAHFGKESLREVSTDEFYGSIKSLRHLGDRAILRAIHFFGDDERVLKQAAALESGDTKTFFELVIQSGRSSLAYLQNIYSPSAPEQQGLTLALALSEKILEGKGAWRVHGGGFAGAILAFVPDGLKERYSRKLSEVFGEASCHFLKIRKEGGGETNDK